MFSTTATPAMSGCSQTTTPSLVQCVRPCPLSSLPADPSPAEYAQNPFESAHSLDANPFEDPSPKQNAHLQDLSRRERDLERREQELNQRTEYIRKHGRNNWPPCPSSFLLSRAVLMSSSLPPHLPLHFRRDPRCFPFPHHPSLPAMARSPCDPPHQHARLHLCPRYGRE